jgi:hypothetical protein
VAVADLDESEVGVREGFVAGPTSLKAYDFRTPSAENAQGSGSCPCHPFQETAKVNPVVIVAVNNSSQHFAVSSATSRAR